MSTANSEHRDVGEGGRSEDATRSVGAVRAVSGLAQATRLGPSQTNEPLARYPNKKKGKQAKEKGGTNVSHTVSVSGGRKAEEPGPSE